MKRFVTQYQHYFVIGSVMLLGLSAWAFPILKHRYYYPTSRTFMMPDGSPSPEMEAYLKPCLVENGEVVAINLGDTSADIPQFAAFQYLSPYIRMKPEATEFHLRWTTQVAGYTADYKLSYYRKKKKVFFIQPPIGTSRWQNSKLLGKGLTDRDIHLAALDSIANKTNFDVWADKHWEK
ncbi:hypothetical protein EON80_07480 [bacterium]|nr:MAG: hypothetical protein EON80_07480 [bacterium]